VDFLAQREQKNGAEQQLSVNMVQMESKLQANDKVEVGDDDCELVMEDGDLEMVQDETLR